jgi:hypothetical protein
MNLSDFIPSGIEISEKKTNPKFHKRKSAKILEEIRRRGIPVKIV